MHATWYDYKDERVQLIASRKKNAETAILMLHQVKYYFTFRVLVHSACTICYIAPEVED
jgi:hypothetical protein